MIKNKTFYLLEDVDESLDYSSMQPISLNPAVSLFLTQKNIPYKIPEDFYDEYTLRREEDAYFFDQLRWFENFDKWLKGKIGFCETHDIPLARTNYILLKYFVDSIVIQARTLFAMVKKIAASGSSIVYVRNRASLHPKTLRSFRKHEHDAQWGEMLPVVCRLLQVSFEFKDRGGEVPHAPKKVSGEHRERKPCWQFLLKSLLQYFLYEKFKQPACPKSVAEGMTVFFAHTGSRHLDPAIRDLLRTGFRVFSFSGNAGICLNDLVPRQLFHFASQGPDLEMEQLVSGCRNAAEQFKTDDAGLISWVCGKCGFDVREIVLPYFMDFIQNKCLALLVKAKCLSSFFLKNQINCVISHTGSDFDSKCALLAARLSSHIKTICIQHGIDVYNDRTWHIQDLGAFDYYFVAEGISEERFRRALTLDYFKHPQIYQSSHYLKSGSRRNRFAKHHEGVRTVLYIPTHLTGHVRFFNCLAYSALWYFEFQKKIITYFATQKRYQFVLKRPFSSSQFGNDPIIPFIARNNFPSIRIVTGRVMESLRGIDAIIVDRPTTAFFEAVSCQRPVLALYADFLEDLIDKKSAEYFGESLQPFSDAASAIVKIEKFLNSNLTGYIHQLPMENRSFGETLLSIHKFNSVPRADLTAKVSI